MFNHLKNSIKLYITMIFINSMIAFHFSNSNIIIHSLSLVFLGFFCLFSLRDYIYLKRAKNVKNKCNEKVHKETKELSEIEFLAYIKEKQDIKIENEKYSFSILIKEIVYKGNYNERTVAKNIFKQRFKTASLII